MLLSFSEPLSCLETGGVQIIYAEWKASDTTAWSAQWMEPIAFFLLFFFVPFNCIYSKEHNVDVKQVPNKYQQILLFLFNFFVSVTVDIQ